MSKDVSSNKQNKKDQKNTFHNAIDEVIPRMSIVKASEI